ncbi:hypothetical protein DL98DRAFT_542820 [Cadophora sp. DSE1049]|nr:hypothetical protein DL98DRAFT_542820 [Cadophora sp. DSE1049]
MACGEINEAEGLCPMRSRQAEVENTGEGVSISLGSITRWTSAVTSPSGGLTSLMQSNRLHWDDRGITNGALSLGLRPQTSSWIFNITACIGDRDYFGNASQLSSTLHIWPGHDSSRSRPCRLAETHPAGRRQVQQANNPQWLTALGQYCNVKLELQAQGRLVTLQLLLHAERGLRTVLWWYEAISGRTLGRQDQGAVKSATACPAPLVTFISTLIPRSGRCGLTRGRGQRRSETQPLAALVS